MKKRGLSAVVTTLIIILLTIVAIGIVWVVVKNILNKGSEQITLTSLTLDLEIVKATVDDMGTPGDTSDDYLNITVNRNPGEGDLVGINFVISDGDNSVVVRRNTNLAQLGWETFTFDTSKLAVGVITSISIAPIFESSSGKDVIGEVVDTSTSSDGSLGSGDPNYVGPPGGDGGTTPPPDCIPDATCSSLEYICGIYTDPTCGDEVCGPGCDLVTEDCISNICVAKDCTPLDNTTACSNANYECGILNNVDTCGIDVDCSALPGIGNCSEQHPVGNWICNDTNLCEEITYIEGGNVGWYGPPDVTQYFSSDSLTKTDSLYFGYVATFPNIASPDCYPIAGYVYDASVYENAIVELNLVLSGPVSIITGDAYEIWDSMSNCCDTVDNPTPSCP